MPYLLEPKQLRISASIERHQPQNQSQIIKMRFQSILPILLCAEIGILDKNTTSPKADLDSFNLTLTDQPAHDTSYDDLIMTVYNLAQTVEYLSLSVQLLAGSLYNGNRGWDYCQFNRYSYVDY